jgi:ketosteroid isomerase-like protein
MNATLEARLRRLEDERDVLYRLHAYGHALDYGDEATFMDCWTADATLLWPNPVPITGTEAIRAAFRAHTHAPAVFHKHLVIEPLIRVDGDKAGVVSMFARLDRIDGTPQIRVFGRYSDTLIRCPDGQWRFSERIPDIEVFRPGLPTWRADDPKWKEQN